jgi:hypothetical protein
VCLISCEISKFGSIDPGVLNHKTKSAQAYIANRYNMLELASMNDQARVNVCLLT